MSLDLRMTLRDSTPAARAAWRLASLAVRYARERAEATEPPPAASSRSDAGGVPVSKPPRISRKRR